MLYRIGPTKFTWADIDGWVNRTKVQLSGWEAETIKQLGDIYTYAAEEYSEKKVDAPYMPDKMQRASLVDNIKDILRRPVV